MNVFVDSAADNDNYYSLHLLFEKRLGMNLYGPVGREWEKKGFHVEAFGSPTTSEAAEGVYQTPIKMDPETGMYIQNAVTFQKFLQIDFDFIVTVYAAHEKAAYNLVKHYKPDATFIRKIGNIHELPLGFCNNILLGTSEPMPPNVNYIKYHPEHYEGYCYTPPTNHKTVKSFVHNLPSYPYDLSEWNKCEASLADFKFKMHGTLGRDGAMPHLLMPQAIKQSAFVWHVKAHGGGGFVLRQALASGRPCIVRRRYAVKHNASAKDLLEDSVNCIDLDLGIKRVIETLRAWSQPDLHAIVCRNTAEKFKQDVNFGAEAEKIRSWLNNLRRH